jgi:hypothetical protein
MSENNVKYDMRAPPRRRIKGEDPDDQPVFLRKAFVMMSNCPADIGTSIRLSHHSILNYFLVRWLV